MFRRQSRWSLLLLVIASVSCAHAQALSAACPQDENSIRALLRDINATREHGGVTALAKYYAADAVISTDGGERLSKPEYLSELSKQGAGNNTTSGVEPEEVFVTFTHGVAILSYIDKMQNVDLSTGVQYHGTFRESRIFACENGSWKIIFRSEIPRPNMTRVPVESEHANLDDYVGHYTMVQNGKSLGNVTVTRKGDRLYEAWGKGTAGEILPGGHDTFFVRADGLVEQFVRDGQNKVVGIHYIFWDDHIEARRAD